MTLDPIAVIAALTVGTLIAGWREWVNAKRIATLSEQNAALAERLADAIARATELREVCDTSYQTGYNDATAIVNAQRDVELVAARNRAYTAGLDEAQGRRVETNVRAA